MLPMSIPQTRSGSPGAWHDDQDQRGVGKPCDLLRHRDSGTADHGWWSGSPRTGLMPRPPQTIPKAGHRRCANLRRSANRVSSGRSDMPQYLFVYHGGAAPQSIRPKSTPPWLHGAPGFRTWDRRSLDNPGNPVGQSYTVSSGQALPRTMVVQIPASGFHASLWPTAVEAANRDGQGLPHGRQWHRLGRGG